MFSIYFVGLVNKVEHKELLRRAHLLHPLLLPQSLLDAIKPNEQDLRGQYGLVSTADTWEVTAASATSVTVRIHCSSDGVTPFKTADSSLRCVMGSLDNLYSKELNLTVAIPDSPPFLIGK